MTPTDLLHMIEADGARLVLLPSGRLQILGDPVQIDRALPLSKCFDVATMDGLRAYWSLTNLRPLDAKANLAKGARIECLL